MTLSTDNQPHEAVAAVARHGVAASTRNLWIGYACAALGAALFSTKAIFIKLAYAEGINAEALLALRMALSLPFFAIIGLYAVRDHLRRGEPLPGMRLVVMTGAVGMLGYWFASYTDFLSLLYISAQFERLILFTYPGFVVLFGALFFGQPARLRSVLAFAVSYVGLAVIFVTERGQTGPGTAIGAGFVLCAAIAFALYQLFAKGLIGRVGPKLFTCIAMTAAAVPVLLQFVLTQPLGSIVLTPKVFGYGLLLAIGATVLPAFLLNMALHRISAQANSTIATLSPVITIILAVLILGEHINGVEAFGAGLVLAGVGWFTLAERKR